MILNARFVRRLQKRLCQVLAVLSRVITSSAQRLRILLLCFQRIVIKIGNLPRHSKESSSESAPESCSVLPPGPQVDPLPFHHGQTTSVTAIPNNQDALSALPPSPTGMTVPSTVHPTTPPRTSLNAGANNPVPPGGRSSVDFLPIGASNKLRYETRTLAYVLAALYHNHA